MFSVSQRFAAIWLRKFVPSGPPKARLPICTVLLFAPFRVRTSMVVLMLFTILFGLSMDYHVFIISRIRELYDGGMSSDEAVAAGIKSTAGVVTSAAAVMVA